MSEAGHPASAAAGPAAPVPSRRRFLLGDLACDVLSTDDRYARMLAGAYGTRLLAHDGEGTRPADLRIAIRDDPRATPGLQTDRLTVRRSSGLCILEADPMTWEVRPDESPCRVSVAVRDPALREDGLAYHFWILLNRTLLLVGRLTLHAAALAYRGSVSLFAGPKGAGKSTIAVALGRAGAEILADDHVIARRVRDHLGVSGCSGRLRVTAQTERQFLEGALGPETLDVPGLPKKEFPADRFYAARPHEERVVDRLFLLRLGERFDVRPAHRRAALLRLLAETGATLRFHDRSDYAELLAALADLVSRVPCYDLELSPRLADLDRLREFLDGQT